MKDTFYRDWLDVEKLPLDAVTHLILTNRTAATAKPETGAFIYVGDKKRPLKVLDFGCGIGRNTLALGVYAPEWKIVGYDNDHMLSRVQEFCDLRYEGKIPENISFQSDWDKIKNDKFDVIFCCLVLQHICEAPLSKYISDFKNMASKLVVLGRRINDDPKHRSTWTILEENGLFPDEFYGGQSKLIYYSATGDPGEHNIACYSLNTDSMKNTFNNWAGADSVSMDDVSKLITGKNIMEMVPDTRLINFLPLHNNHEIILDFGCGIGRNSFWLANTYKHWTIIGYDSKQMISRVPEFANIKYCGVIPNNLHFISNWDLLKYKKFDKILCNIVLQHIYENDLANYVQDFKNMTSFLLVDGRRYNDDKQRSTWTILEELGLVPTKFYSNNIEVPYSPEGNPEDHNMAYYDLKLSDNK